MITNIIVVDNFYTAVDKTRKFVLSLPFNVTGNFPGYKTKSVTNDNVKSYFEKLIGKKILKIHR